MDTLLNMLKKLVKNNFQSFSFFYSYLKYRIFVVFLISIVVGMLDGFGLAMFIPLLQMVDGQTTADSEELGHLSFLLDTLSNFNVPINLFSILTLILFFFICKGLFKFLEGYTKVLYQQLFIRKIRVTNSNALAKLQFYKFINSDSGRIQNTFSAEAGRVNHSYVTYFGAAQAMVMLGVYLSLALITNMRFALLIAVGGALTNFVFKTLYKKTKQASKEYTNYAHIFQGLLMQKVTNFKYLKATSLIFVYTEKLKERIREMEAVQLRMGILNSCMQAMREPIVILVVVVAIVVQVNYFAESLGSIILSLLFLYRALSFLMGLQKQWNSFLAVSGSLENMKAFIKELKEGEETYGLYKFSQFKSSLVLENISFNYTKQKVLQNVSLTIHKNETVAFVGESGSGKTTLMNILVGLFKQNKGRVLIDGLDYKELDVRTLQKKIGYITQEPVIFSDTVFNNVTFWDEPTVENMERFNYTLKKASIYEFVQGLKGKEQSLLGANGINLSGGQRQRLSIARELYKDIDFLLMDEATSALDSETENAIQNHIDDLKGQYTIIIIAHRLSTIKNADKIVLMNNGEIELAGDFDTLKMESKVFKRMVELQEF